MEPPIAVHREVRFDLDGDPFGGVLYCCTEVLAMLTQFRAGGVGKFVAPGFTDLIKNGVGVFGRLL